MSIEVDIKEFHAATREAIRASSRSAATVINGKHQDLLYKARDYTPKSKNTRIETMHTPGGFITSMVTKYKARAVFKASMKEAKKAGTRFDRIKKVQDGYREMWWNRINGRPQGQNFLKSGWWRAGNMFKRVNAQREGKVFAKPIASGSTPVRATVREAAGTSATMLVSSAIIAWQAREKRPGDDANKERILSLALRRAIPAVTADTRRHMANKLAKELAKLSAKGAR